MHSIPQTIYPSYTMPAAAPSAAHPLVGQAVKDLPEGSETEMKKAVALQAAKTQEAYDSSLKEYNSAFNAATFRAELAEQQIDGVRRKKALAITLLVASILLTVGITVAALATGAWPLLFAAVPCVAGIAYFSYIIDTANQQLRQLKMDINAPGKLQMPQLSLPVYHPERDLDLEKTRITAQNTLASTSLKEFAHSGWTTAQITNYALLDRATQLDDQSRPAFYAHCIHLIQAYGKLAAERSNYYSSADSEQSRLYSELHQWNSAQEASIHAQEMQVTYSPHLHVGRQVRITRHGHMHTYPRMHVSPTVTFTPRWQIDNMRADLHSQYARRSAEIDAWYQSTRNAIENGFTQAVDTLNRQFSTLKTKPATV